MLSIFCDIVRHFLRPIACANAAQLCQTAVCMAWEVNIDIIDDHFSLAKNNYFKQPSDQLLRNNYSLPLCMGFITCQVIICQIKDILPSIFCLQNRKSAEWFPFVVVWDLAKTRTRVRISGTVKNGRF